MKFKIIAALALAAPAAFAGEEESAATTLAGARLPVAAYSAADGCAWPIMSPFLPRGFSASSETGANSGGQIMNWIDVGTPRALTGVMFKPRGATATQDIAQRWQSFRLWGADVPGPYKSTEGMELITSNYLGFAKTDQTTYNALTNFTGVSAHRYYFFDCNRDGKLNFVGFELWSDGPSVEATAPTETDAASGSYLFTGTVGYVPDGKTAEVCVCVADKDLGGDYSAWATAGAVFPASASGLSAGDDYSVAATGVGRGRRYAREFVRVSGGTEWFGSAYCWQFASRGELATPRAYIADDADGTTGLLKTSASVVYDGDNAGSWTEGPTFKSITFALDPSEDYASLRFYPRAYGSFSSYNNWDLWGRVHDVARIEVSSDDGADWSSAVQNTTTTARDLWRIDSGSVPEMTWTTLTNATWAIRTIPNCTGKYIEVVLDRREVSRARWLRVVRATISSQSNIFNCREIELYTVKRGGFVLTVR